VAALKHHKNARMQHEKRRLKRCLTSLLLSLSLLVPVFAWSEGVLNVGLVPSEDPRLIVADNQALLDALHQSLGMEIKPFVATDYNGVVEALRAKKLDIALLGPFSYVLAASIAEVDPIAIPDTQKQGPNYYSLIIARKDRNIHSLTDLKGRTFAFVDPSSTSGHLFPKTAMMRAGLNPDADLRAIFAGSHDASAIAVQNGKVDAAAVADGLLDAAIARGVVKADEIVVVWKSDPIPGSPFVIRRDLPEPLKQRIRAAFASMHDLPWSKGTIIKRWVPATDADFVVVRDTAKVLNLDLRKMK
jgi:phosphonate transport system substrate-binding protein